MQLKSIWIDFSRYNHWANQRLAALFESLDEARARQPIVSSFPSVHATVLHIWDAEKIWLERLNGRSPRAFPSASFQGSFAEALEGWVKQSADLAGFIAGQPDAFFEREIEFHNLAGIPGRLAAWQMIQHCFNHSTYHRGQLVTMARQCRLERIPATDFVEYLRQKAKHT